MKLIASSAVVLLSALAVAASGPVPAASGESGARAAAVFRCAVPSYLRQGAPFVDRIYAARTTCGVGRFIAYLRQRGQCETAGGSYRYCNIRSRYVGAWTCGSWPAGYERSLAICGSGPRRVAIVSSI